jgi:aryl-alcohol dehydrogenase-like predicted oxidoreductase
MTDPVLALGTVQLGIPYGIANQTGKPDLNVAFRILDLAWHNNIDIWDTSPVYGDSETIIGKYVKNSQNRPKVCSKLPSLNAEDGYTAGKSTIREYIEKKIAGSLSRLCIDKIDYYLIHDERDFCNLGNELLSEIDNFKGQKLLDKIGISVYSPDIAIAALKTGKIDAIQLPFNLFDRRFSEAIALADSLGITVFIRSVFLQGLFFLSDHKIQEFLPEASGAIKELNILSKKYDRSIAQMAMSYVRGLPGITAILVGVETPDQLSENLALFSSTVLSEDLHKEIDMAFQNLPTHIVNPATWKIKK